MLERIQYDEKLSVKAQLLNIHSYPIHHHRDFQILYVLEGELSLTLFYATYRLQPGSIHIIHSEDVHSIKSITKNNLVLVLSFDSDYFQSIFPHFITTVFITNIEEGAFEKRDALCNDIFTIVAETCDKSSGYVSRINNAAVSLINTLMHHFRGFVIEPNRKVFIHKTSHDYLQVDRISRVIQYVYEHYPYKISLSEIAENEQVSSYYLSHMFHKLVGINFRDFLSMVRVEMSEAAVLSTDRSIAQIAQDVGFSDAKYYVKHFHDHLGCHPREYRKMYAHQVYGKAYPDKEEYPLSKLKAVIGNYTQYPVFEGSFRKTYRIEMDFDAPTCGRFPKPGVFPSIVRDSRMDALMANCALQCDCTQLYQSTTPHEFAMELLKALTSDPASFRFSGIDLVDRPDSIKGLLTINGLQKPLYHLLLLWDRLPDNLVDSGENWLVLQDCENKYLLLFNPGDDAVTVDVISKNIRSGHKLTKYFLREQRSCLNFWAQLDFNGRLNDEEIMAINRMSAPEIEFEILPRMERYYISLDLSSHDIILLTFSKY